MLTINQDRFLALMSEQAQIGATSEGGLSRPALSENDVLVREWFKAQVEKHGLNYAMDGAGSQTAKLATSNANAKTLLIGSHLDSVPNGGRFDGALGVVSALEALLSLHDSNIQLPFHVEVINFTDEEGSISGLFGSRALTGKIEAVDMHNVRGGRDQLLAGMERIGINEASVLHAKRDPDSLLGYIEVHIEQGTRLEEAKVDIGVVTSIVGIRSYWLNFIGEAAHAGTRPMDKRRDAFWGAATFSQRSREAVMSRFHPGVVNIGEVHLAPGAFNIVPREAKIALEFRHGDEQQLDAMQAELFDIAKGTAQAFNLELQIEDLGSIPPAPMSEPFMQALEASTDQLGLSSTRLLSFAGHDAQSMATICDSAIFFVPSVAGISHNPAEFTTDADCINAANVMLHTILKLASTYA